MYFSELKIKVETCVGTLRYEYIISGGAFLFPKNIKKGDKTNGKL